MAGLHFSGTTGSLTTGTGLKGMLRVTAPANQRVRVHRVGISFDGVDPAGKPVTVQIVRSATDGSGDSVTAVKKDDSLPETVQTSIIKNISGETTPVAADIIDQFELHPQAGRDLPQLLDSPLWIKGGGALAVYTNAVATTNAAITLDCEE